MTVHLENIVEELRARGHRMTVPRRSIIEVLYNTSGPVAAKQVQESLVHRGVAPNRTTVYRELDFLLREGIIEAVDFGDGKKRYELAQEHHHHLVCMACGRIEEVQLTQDFLKEEERIAAQHGFNNVTHALEFFGTCQSCSNNN